MLDFLGVIHLVSAILGRESCVFTKVCEMFRFNSSERYISEELIFFEVITTETESRPTQNLSNPFP